MEADTLLTFAGFCGSVLATDMRNSEEVSLSFLVDWVDPQSSLLRNFRLTYHLGSSEVEMIDAKANKGIHIPFLNFNLSVSSSSHRSHNLCLEFEGWMSIECPFETIAGGGIRGRIHSTVL